MSIQSYRKLSILSIQLDELVQSEHICVTPTQVNQKPPRSPLTVMSVFPKGTRSWFSLFVNLIKIESYSIYPFVSVFSCAVMLVRLSSHYVCEVRPRACVWAVFHSHGPQGSIIWLCHLLFTHSPFDEHSNCFQVLPITHNDAVNSLAFWYPKTYLFHLFFFFFN